MGGPYLESGESIVLTTDRVSIDAVMYQAMLTTRRLILIDSRNIRFEPQIVSLPAIQTVGSGKAATGEPVIILTLQEQGYPQKETRILIFSQEPAENRKPDRDLWLKTFIELSVSSRESKTEREVPASEERTGIRPTIRRWVAPEIIRPRTDNFPVKEPAPEIVIGVDVPEPVTVAEVAPAIAPNTGEEKQEEYAGQGSLVRATRTAVQSLAEPEPETPVSLLAPEHDTPEPVVISSPPAEPVFNETDTTSTLSVSILAAVKSLTAGKPQEQPGPDQPAAGGPAPDDYPEIPYESPVRFTSRLPDNPDPHPALETTESPVSHPSGGEMGSAGIMPVYEEPTAGIRSTSQLPEIPPRHTQEEPEPPSTPLATDPVGPEVTPEPATEISSSEEGLPAQEEESGKSPDPTETRVVPPALQPNPQKGPAPGGYPLLLTSGIILCLLLVIAGVLLLSGIQPRDSGQDLIIPTPVMTPAMVLTPSSTPTSVPVNGTWVRIVSPGYFIGQLGNPGSLQQVSGSGERWFKVRESTGLVKVSVEKQDYSGDALRVEIYSGGRVITSRLTSAPQGTVDLLIDPATGGAPGIIETPAPTGSRSPLEYQ